MGGEGVGEADISRSSVVVVAARIKPAAPESAYPRKKNSGCTHVHVHIGRRRVVGGRESVCGHGKTIGLFVVYELRLAGIRLSLLDSGSK